MQPAQQPAQQADPKMMQVYQRLSLAAMKIIYDPKTAKGLVDVIKQAGSTPAAVAHAALIVIKQIQQQAKGIDPGMVNAIAPAVVAMLFDLSQAAGLMKFTPDLLKQTVEFVKQGDGGQSAASSSASSSAPAQPVPQPATQPSGGLIGQSMTAGA